MLGKQVDVVILPSLHHESRKLLNKITLVPVVGPKERLESSFAVKLLGFPFLALSCRLCVLRRGLGGSVRPD